MRKRRKGANSANAALARRLCEISWYCLKENRAYKERELDAFQKRPFSIK